MINSLSLRSNYKTLKKFTYLNQASLGLISEKTATSMIEFLNEIAKHGNAHMSDQDEVNFFQTLRNTCCRLFNCNSRNLAILSSASELLNQLPYLLDLKKGSKVVLVKSDFPALFRPWQAFSEKNKLKTHFVDEDLNVDLTSSITKRIDNETVAVVVSYIQYATGSRIDLQRLQKITKKLNIPFVIDVTQAAGAIPLDISKIECDAMVCSGYKWLGGHGGVAIAYLSDNLINKTPLMPGWMGAKNPFNINNDKLDLAFGAKRYTQSTMSYVSLKSLNVSIKEILNLGIQNIASHSEKLKKYLLSSLNKDRYKTLNGNEKLSSSHIISISNNEIDSTKLSKILFDNGIICSLRNGFIRISLAHYNDQTDIDKLLSVLNKL